MTTPELIDYIKKSMEGGLPIEDISAKLKANGWEDADIQEAMNIIFGNPVAVSEKEKIFLEDTETMISERKTDSVESLNMINTTHEEPNFKRSKNKIKYVLVTLVPIILLVGGFYAYASGYFLDTDKISKNLINSFKDNKNFSYQINIDIQGQAPSVDTKLNNETTQLNLSGEVGFSDEEKIELHNLLSLDLSGLKTEIRTIKKNDVVYFNILEIPDFGFFSLEPITNKWISIVLEKNTGILNENPLLSMAPVDMSILEKITDDKKLKIEEITKGVNFFKITKKHIPSITEGELLYHFNFDLDRESIVSYAKGISSLMKEPEGEILNAHTNNEGFSYNFSYEIDGQSTVYDQDSSSVSSMMDLDYDKMFSRFENFKGEAWIGLFDNLPRKIKVDFDYVDTEDTSGHRVKTSLVALFDNWNSSVSIETPNESVKAEDLLSELMGNMFNNEEGEIDKLSPGQELKLEVGDVTL